MFSMQQATGSNSTFFSAPLPPPLLPLPPENADINGLIRHWVTVAEPKFSKQQADLALEKLKVLLTNPTVNLMQANPEGDTALHCAAMANNKDFFQLVFKNPKLRAQININAKSAINGTPLSYAINTRKFALAIQLIEQHHASINVLVNVSVIDPNKPQMRDDGTCSILRKALVQCIRVALHVITQEQKESLEKLVHILINRGLQFFATPESSSPAAIEFATSINELTNKDKDAMAQYNLSEIRYRKLCGMDKLREKYPAIFEKFWVELIAVKNNLQHPSNVDAQELWDIWQHRVTVEARNQLRSGI